MYFMFWKFTNHGLVPHEAHEGRSASGLYINLANADLPSRFTSFGPVPHEIAGGLGKLN